VVLNLGRGYMAQNTPAVVSRVQVESMIQASQEFGEAFSLTCQAYPVMP
jgi:hypothetical protein